MPRKEKIYKSCTGVGKKKEGRVLENGAIPQGQAVGPLKVGLYQLWKDLLAVGLAADKLSGQALNVEIVIL